MRLFGFQRGVAKKPVVSRMKLWNVARGRTYDVVRLGGLVDGESSRDLRERPEQRKDSITNLTRWMSPS